jgi:hypothetical protein
MAVFTAIGAAIGSFFGGITMSAIGAFALRTVASMGLSALAQRLAGNKTPGADLSVNGQIGQGADAPQSFGVGVYATAGTLTYANTASDPGKPNVWLYWVITLSDMPVKSMKSIWVNGEKRILSDHTGGWKKISGFGTDNLQVKFYDGTQTISDGTLTGSVSTTERPWVSSAIGRGRAYAIVRGYLKEGVFPNGFPNFLFELEGIPLYNIAKDTTAGGSGTHRWSTPSTWESSQNPAVQLYNVLRGIRYNGEWFYGLQDVTAAQLPSAHWRAQIAKCAYSVPSNGGGTESQFRASGEIPVGAPIVAIVEALLTTMNGRLSDAGGVYKLFSGAPGAPVMSFTDEDILSTSEQTFTPFFGLSDTINGVSGSYPSPAAAWQSQTAPPLYSTDFEAEDGNRRLLVDMPFDYVPYAEQVQRLMKMGLAEARRARRHTIAMPPEFWVLEAGDVVSWTSERNGYLSKQFRVDGIVDLGNADVVMDITEVDPSDYDFDTNADFEPTNIPGSSIQPIPIQVVTAFSVFPAFITDTNGDPRRPAIRATWDPVPDVSLIVFETRVAPSNQSIPPNQTTRIDDGVIYIADGVLPLTDYQVRAKFIPDGDRPTEWTEWLAVTTLDIRLQTKDLATQITDKIEENRAELADMVGITYSPTLPASGDKPDQIVMTSDGTLYRWDAGINEWTRALFGGIKPGDVDITGFASGLEPVTIIATGPLPAVKSTSAIVWDGKLYRWNCTAYTSAVPAVDVTGQLTSAQIAALDAVKLIGTMSPDRIGTGAILNAKLADNAVTVAKIANGAVSGPKLEAGSVIADKIATNAVTADKILANSVTTVKIATDAITAGKIAAGAVNTRELAAGSIVAAKIAVADFTNLVPGGDLTDESAWGLYSGWSLTNPHTLTAPQATGTGVITRTSGTYLSGLPFPVTPGAEYFVSYLLGRLAEGNVRAWVDIEWFANDGVRISYSNVFPETRLITSGGVFFANGVVSAPVGAATAQWRFAVNADTTAATMFFLSPTMRLRANGSLIVDGAITANSLATDSVTANAIKAGAVVAASIATGAVTASKINVTSLSAISGNMGTFTSGTTSGARTVISGDKIEVYDSSNKIRVRIGKLT